MRAVGPLALALLILSACTTTSTNEPTLICEFERYCFDRCVDGVVTPWRRWDPCVSECKPEATYPCVSGACRTSEVHDRDASACMPESDAGPDVTTDAACDTGGACCCDIDVIVTPTCGDAGLVCPSFYTLLPAAECKRCVLGGDTGPGG